MTWFQVTCDKRERIIDSYGRSYNGFSEESGVRVLAGRTDMDGEFGEPYILTVWGEKESEVPVLKDERWPDSDRTCEHHVWVMDEPSPYRS